MITASGLRRSNTLPLIMFGGAPTSVASSSPSKIVCWKLPSSSRERVRPLYNRTAHDTPDTPRTRYKSFSESGFTSSENCTLGSITQMLAPWISRICPLVCSISPQKIDACCAMSSDANAIPRMIPRYLPRLPVSILSAIQLIASLQCRSSVIDDLMAANEKSVMCCR